MSEPYVSAWPGLDPRLLARGAARRAAPPFPAAAPRTLGFHVARHGIYQLFCALDFSSGASVLVPAYHHGNEVRAIRASGARVRFYSIGADLQPDLDEVEQLLRSRPRALYVIHYLGWPQPIEELERLCRRRGTLLIEDCALALLSGVSGGPLGSFGDYAVFCLYKTLPVPNGGLLAQNRGNLAGLQGLGLRGCGALSIGARLLELTADWVRGRAPGLGRSLFAVKRGGGRALTALGLSRRPVGDTGFDPSCADMGMSRLSAALLRRFDYAAIKAARRRNFTLLDERLGPRFTPPTGPLEPGVCPLFYPILVREKARAAEQLAARGVEAVTFWNEGDPEAERLRFDDVRFLRRHLLELPIHQDLAPAQLDHLAERALRLEPMERPGSQKWPTSSRSTVSTASTA
jgi:dTDP-4-amino-4,6-dideoxygalactose transaminase